MAGNPASYKAAIITNPGRKPHFEVKTLALPELGPTDILVKLSVSGVCGTDFALASGELGPTCSILGQEGIGRVVSIGSGLSESTIPIGQRVGVAWIRDVRGECAMCLHDGGGTRCIEQIHSGRKVNVHSPMVPRRYIMKLPEGLADEHLAPIICGGVTSYKALKTCGAVPGQWIVISGARGGVGALGIMFAVAVGFRVIAIDAGSVKGDYCLEIGAHHYFDVTKEQDIASAVKAVADGKGAAAVLATAEPRATYQSALDLLGPFRTLVCIRILPPSQKSNFHPLSFIDNGFTIIGSIVGTRGDTLEAIEFVKRKAVVPAIQMMGLGDLNDVAKMFSSGRITGKIVVPFDDARAEEYQSRL